MSDPVISPDGLRIAYTLNDKLYIRALDQFQSRVVAGTEGASNPFWSPDGSMLAYFAKGKVWKIPDLPGEEAL